MTVPYFSFKFLDVILILIVIIKRFVNSTDLSSKRNIASLKIVKQLFSSV